jgi:hypothetical protein
MADFVGTTRLELQTQLSLMASFIFGSIDKITVEQSIDIAIEIKDGVDRRVNDFRTRRKAATVENEEKEKVQTTRLDLKTRICFMSSIIYGSIDGIKINEAIEEAVRIENASDARVKKMKRDNPVFPDEQKQEFARRKQFVKETELKQ